MKAAFKSVYLSDYFLIENCLWKGKKEQGVGPMSRLGDDCCTSENHLLSLHR